ncbi:MAG TPA: sigma-54 dependent transcriptional regulator [Saprospiraceae bacterium]|nr:sigma-54 dependent transcriptional regulator [Saprospiraceae bacterium]HPN68511.1 sigma-54 dependent transcriptional regulator [Saprospiraceae bacterium]
MSISNIRILAIDDDVDVLTALRLLLKGKVKEIITEKNPNNLLSLIKSSSFDLIILDMNFNGMINTGNEGLYWLNKIKETDASIDVILITAYGEIELAIKSLKNGASDFVLKPWSNQKLIDAVTQIEKKRRKSKEKKVITTSQASMIGKSDVIAAAMYRIEKIAPTDANVLLLGENGTGKDIAARIIHDLSHRKNGPFIKVDVGSLASSLFESELFGYKKGAFTDAREDRKGRFQSANGGTLFLDEIGNITLQQQAVLLSVLQNRQVLPLGSSQPIPVDIRLICATNITLRDLADENKFRKDLIYRINTVEVVLPPLREREEDILLLADYFLEMYCQKYQKNKLEFSKTFIDKLLSYHFPGNVRELQYALERAVIMSEDDVLKSSDLVFSPIEKFNSLVEDGDNKLDNIEKNTILNVIEKNNGNISKSAKELGITRTALYRRLNKYGL